MQEYDKSSKWLIQHHGDSILRLAGVRDIVAWRPLQAELVQPRRLPDGLIEVQRAGRDEPALYVLEISTYPYTRLAEQAARDTLLVYLDRGTVPEVLVLVLHPQGNLQSARQLALRSPEGSTGLQVSWQVIELWTVPAEDLLAAGDVGLIPWVPLARLDGPPEPIFRQCRERIDRDASPNEHENLLAVTQLLAGLRYNDSGLFDLLGGFEAMIQSPVLQEYIEARVREAADKAADEAARNAAREATREAVQRDVLRVLLARFGAEAQALEPALKQLGERLEDYLELAATCPDLDSFRRRLDPDVKHDTP